METTNDQYVISNTHWNSFTNISEIVVVANDFVKQKSIISTKWRRNWRSNWANLELDSVQTN